MDASLSTYSNLLSDHENVERMAGLLEDDINLPGYDDPRRAVRFLRDVEAVLTRHFAAERQLFAVIEQRGVTELWQGDWPGMMVDFRRMERDCAMFFARWDEEAVADDLSAFKVAIRDFARRMVATTRAETACLYGKALEAGVIQLR